MIWIAEVHGKINFLRLILVKPSLTFTFHPFLIICSDFVENQPLLTLKRKTLIIVMDGLCPITVFYPIFRTIWKQQGFLHCALFLVCPFFKKKRKINLFSCLN